jgi:hypothetical protein
MAKNAEGFCAESVKYEGKTAPEPLCDNGVTKEGSRFGEASVTLACVMSF